MERAKHRDPELETDLFEMPLKDSKINSLGQVMLDPKGYKPYAIEETRKFREYMVNEAIL